MLRTFQRWIATNWLEIEQDNLHTKFSAFNVDFSSSSPDPLGSSRPAQAGVKDSYPPQKWLFYHNFLIIIIIDNRGLNARWCVTPLLLSLPTAAYLKQRGLTPAGLPHTTAQCHLTILGEAVLFCLNHPSFRTPGFLSFYCRPFCRYGRRDATFSVSLSVVWFLPIESFCTILHTIPQVILGKTCLKLLVTLTME